MRRRFHRSRFRSGCGSLSGWRRALAAFGAGAAFGAAMAPFFLSPVLFLTLPVLVWLIDGAAPQGRRAAARSCAPPSAGWWFGFGYFLLGLFWIGEAFLVEAEMFAWLMPFAVLLMPAGLALFTGLAARQRRALLDRPASRASSCWRWRSQRPNGCAATCSPGFLGTFWATR